MKLFGTDGIRGTAGLPPLEPATVARVGAALARTCPSVADGPLRVLIGRDTRESGVWIEQELARGLASAGAAAVSAGIVPTPGVAYLTRAQGFDLGVVISASHNPYADNGIKAFSRSGEKIGETIEAAVERLVADPSWSVPARGDVSVEHIDPAHAYGDHLRHILASAGPLTGSSIVVDCANGATAAMAPALFRSLGFDVIAIGVEPDGRNINLDCGSTHLTRLSAEVIARGARLGIAFDGDGDRALFVDHHGRTVDGDAILLIAAAYLKQEGKLPGSAIVATVMSNIGLEIALRERGIALARCPVGDKFVMEEMAARGLVLGGEQSGHVIFADHLSTGDGMATALHILKILAARGGELSDLAAPMVPYPQVLLNVRVREKADYMQVPAIAAAVRRVEAALDGQGRLLVRYSGTEPLLRIMLEGRHQDTIRAWADEIAGAVREHLT